MNTLGFKKLGLLLGYPECCIDYFENISLFDDEHAERRSLASEVNGRGTGFLPCPYHADLILNNVVTLSELIHGRNPKFAAFPLMNSDDTFYKKLVQKDY